MLITGVAGFTGTHLAPLCAERGAEVLGIGRGPRPELPGLGEYEQLDLNDASGLRAAVARMRPDWVVHLAAEASVVRALRAPTDVVKGNLTTSLNLLEAVRTETPDAAVLMACSAGSYGRPEYLPVDEQHPFAPLNPYATSKALVDQLAASYERSYGMRVIRARTFNFAGPGQTDAYVIGKLACRVAEAEATRPPDGRAEITAGNLAVRRDFCDVRDGARAYWLALEGGLTGVFNVCSGRGTLLSDILADLAGHASLEVVARTDPSLLRDDEVMEIVGSHDKLTEATGWRPEIEQSKMLLDTLDWWREHLAVGAAG